MNKKTKGLSEPLQITRESFINAPESNTKITSEPKAKGRAQPVTFTLNSSDIEVLEKQIDRATILDRRSKSKSAIIRMALRALQNSSDIDYLVLYEQF